MKKSLLYIFALIVAVSCSEEQSKTEEVNDQTLSENSSGESEQVNETKNKQAEMWDNRYDTEEYVYGIEPNQFLKSVLDSLEPGSILFPAEGEGRNAVYAAELGWDVDATDLSKVGKEKALKLAADRGVEINYEVADVTQFETDSEYDVIAFIFLHLPKDKMKEVLNAHAGFLKPGGKLVIEVFNPGQLQNSSGGPKNEELLYTLEELKEMLSEMNLEYAEEVVFELSEGPYHTGEASTCRVIALK